MKISKLLFIPVLIVVSVFVTGLVRAIVYTIKADREDLSVIAAAA